MNTNTTRNSAFVILALIGMLAFSACSQKPSSEEIAAQVKTAMAEEKAREQAAASAAAATPAPVAEVAAPKPAAKYKRAAQAKPTAPARKIVCDNCGVVISVQEIELEGKGSGLGAIAGGVAGGLAGNQVGQGTGRDLATVVGVVGGAIAGNKIEQKIKKAKVYDVAVKMDSGEERILRYETAPGVMAGDKIKVEGEQITRQ
ncbi:MAG: glycine zipper 2TM domain-containing protein [Sideroxyarcus sp.]